MTRPRPRILVLATILTLVLVGMVGLKQYTLVTGAMVTLTTEPIDPRSLFRGDFARLNFTISRVQNADYTGKFERGQTVYVLLDTSAPQAKLISVNEVRPVSSSDRVVMKARVFATWNDTIQLKYGIENYFVPEGTGLELERREPGREVTVDVAVDRFGNSAIKTLLVDGEPYHSETFF